MKPSTSLGTRSNVDMAKPSPPVRQAGNIWRLLMIPGVCRRSVPEGCPQVKYRCRCRVKAGRLTHEEASHQLEAMAAIVHTLRRLDAEQRQLSLFGTSGPA